MTGPFRPPTGGPAGFPGQGGQPIQPHPTVGNFGLPVQQPQMVQPQQQASADQGGWRMPPAPVAPQTFDPAQQSAQIQQPQQFQQPQQVQHPTAQFGQPVQPQPQPQRGEIPDNVILDGANVPPELRGRSWGQIKQIYGALANDFVLRQGTPAPRQEPQGRPAVQPQRAPVYEQGRGGQPVNGSFWEDPEGTIDRAIERRMAPVVQRTTAMAIQEARAVARLNIPDFDYLEGDIMQIVQGADGQALTDPQLWQSTAELARGRMMGRGQYDSRMATQPRSPQPSNGFARGPGVSVPAPVSPIPVGQFFTEAPTPPNFAHDGYGTGVDVQSRVAGLTNDQRAYASKMNMTLEDYVAWSGGVQQSAPVRRY